MLMIDMLRELSSVRTLLTAIRADESRAQQNLMPTVNKNGTFLICSKLSVNQTPCLFALKLLPE